MGDYFDAANLEHGFLSSGGTFTTITGSTPRSVGSGFAFLWFGESAT